VNPSAREGSGMDYGKDEKRRWREEYGSGILAGREILSTLRSSNKSLRGGEKARKRKKGGRIGEGEGRKKGYGPAGGHYSLPKSTRTLTPLLQECSALRSSRATLGLA